MAVLQQKNGFFVKGSKLNLKLVADSQHSNCNKNLASPPSLLEDGAPKLPQSSSKLDKSSLIVKTKDEGIFEIERWLEENVTADSRLDGTFPVHVSNFPYKMTMVRRQYYYHHHHHHHHIRFYIRFTCWHALDGFQKIDF